MKQAWLFLLLTAGLAGAVDPSAVRGRIFHNASGGDSDTNIASFSVTLVPPKYRVELTQENPARTVVVHDGVQTYVAEEVPKATGADERGELYSIYSGFLPGIFNPPAELAAFWARLQTGTVLDDSELSNAVVRTSYLRANKFRREELVVEPARGEDGTLLRVSVYHAPWDFRNGQKVPYTGATNGYLLSTLQFTNRSIELRHFAPTSVPKDRDDVALLETYHLVAESHVPADSRIAEREIIPPLIHGPATIKDFRVGDGEEFTAYVATNWVSSASREYLAIQRHAPRGTTVSHDSCGAKSKGVIALMLIATVALLRFGITKRRPR